jgi:hypothetical protein
MDKTEGSDAEVGESETASSGQAVVSPPEGGVATPIKQMSRYLSLGVAGEVRMLATTGV